VKCGVQDGATDLRGQWQNATEFGWSRAPRPPHIAALRVDNAPPRSAHGGTRLS
jgi:hypothetical protein